MKQRNSLLLLALLLLLGGRAAAQSGPYGNEWIDHNKSYFKIRVGATGVYRLSRAALEAMGLPATVQGSQFQLFRDGKEVPLWASAETMGAADFIEFIGYKMNGLLDKELYQQQPQANDRISLYSDSATYFLTWNGGGSNLRYTQEANVIPGSLPPAEPWCWSLAGQYFNNGNRFSYGPTQAPGNPFYSSQYEGGEGFVNDLNHPSVATIISLATPNLVATAPVNALATTNVLTMAYNNLHEMQVQLNNQLLGSQNWGPSDTRTFSNTIPASTLNAGGNQFRYSSTNTGPQSYDNYGASFVEIRYPRDFSLSGATFFTAGLPASSSAQYVEFQQLGTQQGRLYDVTNRRWYEGDYSVSGKLRFYLQPSLSEREIVLIGSGAAVTVAPMKYFQFIDHAAAARQGNYIILTHPKLLQGGANKVQEYAAYRRSTDGGAFQVQISDVTLLYDQFAYGCEGHPLALRHYLQYAYDTWAIKPKYTFLIGRGLQYHQRSIYAANSSVYTFPMVPTFGYPGSDVDLVNFDGLQTQKIMIGRLTAWTDAELGTYLDKIKVQEAALRPVALPTPATEWWKKQVLHIVGGTNQGEQSGLLWTMDAGKAIIQDSGTGRVVTTVLKNTTGAVQTAENQLVENMLDNGLSQITFHGHAAASGFEYNINNPEQYTNSPRIPMLLALGCDVAQMFYVTPPPNLSTNKTIAEKYVFAPGGGSIATVAASTEGFPSFHRPYLDAFYRSEATTNYGASIGRHTQFVYDSLKKQFMHHPDSMFYFAHLESMQLIGDPAARTASNPLPDYYIDANLLSTQPSNITTSNDSFTLRITALNLGRATANRVKVKIEHTNPAGTTSTAGTYFIPMLYNSDTSFLRLPVNKITDLGLNRLTVKVDADDSVSEASEANNIARLDVFIYSDNLVPVYPKEFAIVHEPGVTLKASTLNAFRPAGRYVIQIDTTEHFNSSLRQETFINSVGGVLKWKPNMIYRDSTVYYWRAAYNDAVNGDTVWSGSSFVYLANGSDGWNQSHFFQYGKDRYQNMRLDADRKFRFADLTNHLTVKNIVAYTNDDGENGKIYYNNAYVQGFSQDFAGSVQIMVIDSCTGTPFRNTAGNTQGAYPPNGVVRGVVAREFTFSNMAGRMAAAKYLDSIPDGHYVFIKNAIYDMYYPYIWTIADLRADSATNGGNSLYHAIKRMGFDQIDSFNAKRVFVFGRRKGRTDFPVYQKVGSTTPGEAIIAEFDLTACRSNGEVLSTVIGPASKWETLRWRHSPLDTFASTDSPQVRIVGIDAMGAETPLYTGRSYDVPLSFISAATYPNLRLQWLSYDSIRRSSPQLDYWRVLYTPVPEAALNAAAKFAFTDSVSVGQQMEFRAAIENLTPLAMDSMLVRYKVIDANGVTHTIGSRRYRPLPGNDTLEATFTFDPAPYPGSNVFFVEANPDGDQPEQYHPNNLGYLPFRIATDKTNPLLDVTFDGVHILDGDIVSAKPFIRIKLKDENQYLALDDTAMLKLRLMAPGGSRDSARVIPFDGTVCRFIPASTTERGRNEAIIEYRPSQLQDGTHQLFVSGRDKTGNRAGNTNTDYSVSFEVYNKPAITQVLNYPNPFSTSTAFVFTLTGSEIPQQFKIQILSVTGKVVREITKAELGPLHIGRNITDYKWDGRDQFGQLLGNGVYLYRVVTTLNGKSMDAFNGLQDSNGRTIESKTDGAGAAVDKFFKGGYGKMYIMR